jgi:hypothetical protein
MSILWWLASLPYPSFFLIVTSATILVSVLLILVAFSEDAARRVIRVIKAAGEKQQYVRCPRCRLKIHKGGWQ